MSVVRESDLIGIGKKYQIETEAGDNMIVVIHDDGKRELYRSEDDDSETHCVMTLSDEESRHVAGILGGLSYKPKALETIEVALDDLRIEWYKVAEANDGVNKSIGELEVRQRTGASIIAAINGDDTVINPGPDYVITPNTTLVIAGKKLGIKLLKEILI